MKAVIVVPFRADRDGRRERNWEFAENWWRELELPICLGDSSRSQPFDVTQARNAAVEGATQAHPEWNVALMTDADAILGSHDQAKAALSVAYITGAYTVAHSELRYLSQMGTHHAITSGDIERSAIEMRIAETWETVFCFRRTLWEELGGFDPRFRGFGHQVEAFMHAATTIAGRERIPGNCYHLYHHYSADLPHPHLPANRQLVERYWEAAGDELAMRALLGEYAVAV